MNNYYIFFHMYIYIELNRNNLKEIDTYQIWVEHSQQIYKIKINEFQIILVLIPKLKNDYK